MASTSDSFRALQARPIVKLRFDDSFGPTSLFSFGLVAFCQECLLQGVRVVGKTGRSREEMTGVADAVMKLMVKFFYEHRCRPRRPSIGKTYLFGDI
jgi:hypothetical protein